MLYVYVSTRVRLYVSACACVREGILLSSFSQSNRNPPPAKRIVDGFRLPFNFNFEEPSKSLPARFCVCVCLFVCIMAFAPERTTALAHVT